MTVPLVDGLAERKVRPDELFADSGRNAFEASRRGTELVSPVAGSAPGTPTKERETDRRRYGADFQIDVTGDVPRRAPVRREYELEDAPERVPLCQGNMRALPLAVPLPGEAGPACGGLLRRTW